MIIKVLCNFPPPSGGAEILAEQLVRAFHIAGHDVSVVTNNCVEIYSPRNKLKESYFFDPESHMEEVWKSIPINAVSIRKLIYDSYPQSAQPIDVTFMEGLKKDLVEDRPEIVHYHLPMGKLRETVQVNNQLGLPLIVTCHGMLDLKPGYGCCTPDGLASGEIIAQLKQVTQVVVVSKEIEAFVRASGIDHVTRIPNGIDLMFYRPKKYLPREGILYVGKNNRNKGIRETLLAYLIVSKRFRETIYLVGRGVTFEAFLNNDFFLSKNEQKTLLNAYERGWVHFLSELNPEALRDYYQQCRMLVLPSYSEGLPLSLMEALACGLPVISSEVGDIKDLITPGRNGMLIPRANVEALAEAMALLLRQQGFDQDMCRKSVAAFGIETAAQNYIECFRKAKGSA